MSPCAVVMLRINSGMASSFVMSSTSAEALSFPWRSTNLSRFSLRRPVTMTEDPSATSFSARASPIPGFV